MNILLLLLTGAIASVSSLSIRCFQMTLQRSPIQGVTYQVCYIGIGGIIYLILAGGAFPSGSAAWLLGLAFGICLAVAGIGTFQSYTTGPMSLTSIVISCNVVLPILVGCFAYQEALRLPHLVGIALLIVTFILSGLGSKGAQREIKPIWYLMLLLGFLGNGFGAVILSTVSKLPSPGSNHSFLAVGFLSGALLLLSYALLHKAQHRDAAIRLQLHPLLFVLLAVSTLGCFGCNTLLLHLNNVFPSTVLYPIYNGTSSVLVCLISCLVFREPMDKKKFFSILLGIGAVVLLNL